jgi:hypothetical protein
MHLRTVIFEITPSHPESRYQLVNSSEEVMSSTSPHMFPQSVFQTTRQFIDPTMLDSQLSIATIFAFTLVLIFSYGIFLAVYRLHFSPLAKFPGPRLAALTLWYEFYFDVVRVQLEPLS